uniref:Uncharacterized protein n=1 Tax=Meloidogyne enterolobii TaxID=390850 RepID=A0A6V7UN81_MELEN|nr:unnamed protein product [Meloidogyne enterolobii]
MRFTRKCFSSIFGTAICNKLEQYSQYRPSSLTIQQYLDFGLHGTAKTSFSFLKTELLVRLANIMKLLTYGICGDFCCYGGPKYVQSKGDRNRFMLRAQTHRP